MSKRISPLRRLPIGAEVTPDGVHFRVWAPKRKTVEVRLQEGTLELEAEGDGYFSGLAEGLGAGARYEYRLDGGDTFPDPASRFQPEGPHGPSQVVDPSFPWTDGDWQGVRREGQVLYEMHVGTFTPEGTWTAAARESPGLDLPPPAFVSFLQNHDQVANSGRGERCHLLSSPGRFRAMTALLLLAPATPMLLQGQEFCASAPFLYFADHEPDLASRVRKGRLEFLSQFPSLNTPEMQSCVPAPQEAATFELCKLDLSERASHAPCYALHRDLLRLRREDPVFRAQGAGGLDGAVLTPEAFVLRLFSGGDDRLLVVNLGRDLQLVPAPEPLLAPPHGARWQVLWSSEDPRYGGCGAPPPEDRQGGWRLPGQAAVVLQPVEEEE